MSMVVGRTGCGKTALLILLRESSTHVTWLEPDELSLQYLSNSTIIQYLDKLGGKRENASPRNSVWFGTSTRSERSWRRDPVPAIGV
jgi:ABC-type cobalamin/Fe3+-siderophores transport system ATPase subunit